MYIIQLQSITYICMIWSDLIWYDMKLYGISVIWKN
jgi:hypothetical protein